jgi:hypothetical protein
MRGYHFEEVGGPLEDMHGGVDGGEGEVGVSGSEAHDAGCEHNIWHEAGRTAEAVKLAVGADERGDGIGGLDAYFVGGDARVEETIFHEGRKE